MVVAGAVTWPADVLQSALRLALQNLLQEEEAGVADASRQLWQTLLRQTSQAALAQALPEETVQVGFASDSWHAVALQSVMSRTHLSATFAVAADQDAK